MDISQFPERIRAKVLATVVRSMRAGVALRFGAFQGDALPVRVNQIAKPSSPRLSRMELERWALSACAALPYQIIVEVIQDSPVAGQ